MANLETLNLNIYPFTLSEYFSH